MDSIEFEEGATFLVLLVFGLGPQVHFKESLELSMNLLKYNELHEWGSKVQTSIGTQ